MGCNLNSVCDLVIMSVTITSCGDLYMRPLMALIGSLTGQLGKELLRCRIRSTDPR